MLLFKIISFVGTQSLQGLLEGDFVEGKANLRSVEQPVSSVCLMGARNDLVSHRHTMWLIFLGHTLTKEIAVGEEC